MTTKTRKPVDTHCTVCGRPIAECTVGGLHGTVRDAAVKAAKR